MFKFCHISNYSKDLLLLRILLLYICPVCAKKIAKISPQVSFYLRKELFDCYLMLAWLIYIYIYMYSFIFTYLFYA